MTTSSPPERLRVKLAEQLNFLDRSATLYDQGHEDEALRMAVALRVLFHQTAKSTALMVMLGLGGCDVLSSSRGLGTWKDYLSERIDLSSPRPVTMIPMCQPQFLHPVPFDTWWKQEVVFQHDGTDYTRYKIIWSMANRDGGAHVDDLEKYYEVLCSGKWALTITGNLTYAGPVPFPQGVEISPNNGHFALIRQFAFEVLHSANTFDW